MAKLRVRFSGMCLFHQQNGGLVARVLAVPGHKAELWVDPTTATISTSRQPNSQDECILQNGGAGLTRKPRKVQKYGLAGEQISFINGNGSGPPQLPDVVSIEQLDPGIPSVDPTKPVGAVISLNRGEFVSGPPVGVTWMNMPADRTGPSTLPIWTDLVIETNDASFKIGSDAREGGWELTPTGSGDVEVWVLSDVAVGTGELDHFTHFFGFLAGESHGRPFPELHPSVTLPTCPDGSGVPERVNALLVGGNTFCPDGKR